MEDEEPNLSAEEDGADNLAAGDLGGFEPTEDELVLHFLRPQLRGFPPRVAGAVLEADPCAAAPWELLARYGLRDQGHFFAARGRGRGRPSVRRAVAGAGAWMHSSTRAGRSVTDLGVVVRWSRVKFCFYAGGPAGAGQGQQRSTGWVMEEYEITDPRCYRRCDEEGEEDDYWVLCRVRKSKRPAAASPPARQRWRRLDELEPDSGAKAKISRPLRT
ncbi:hypothetical protein GQ55_5G021000 [Panicum hallii var. hallii]|uniref:NAC domain-containing protein n=1 Tax=Panicum hallii var. hallii TaxID=1504633 RepID=A0A2T7DBT7_9POAL|nr:hypothetical protein GQ55_5G021000 [Panicum hallii var. hallii]